MPANPGFLAKVLLFFLRRLVSFRHRGGGRCRVIRDVVSDVGSRLHLLPGSH